MFKSRAYRTAGVLPTIAALDVASVEGHKFI
jgi:hypothetical protein